MKTNFSRIGKKTLSVVIAMMMVISTMLVGTVTTNAATAESDSVGEGEYYLWYQDGKDNPANYTKKLELQSKGSNLYEATAKIDTSEFHCAIVNQNASTAEDNSIWTNSSKPTVTYDTSLESKKNYIQSGDWGTYGLLKFSIKTEYIPITLKFTFNSETKAIHVSESSSTQTTYNVTTGVTTNGSFTVSHTSAAVGATITVRPSADTGYEVDTVKYTYGTTTADATKQDNGTYSFTMPASNVTVNVTFKETTTPTATYYIGGRFHVKDSTRTADYYTSKTDSTGWNASCKDEHFTFTKDTDNENEYYINTYMTTAELSATIKEKEPLFFIHTGSGNSSTWYGASEDNDLKNLETTSYLTPGTLAENTGDTPARYMKFNDAIAPFDENVVIHFNPSIKQIWITSDTSSKGDFTIEDKTDVNGTLSFSAPNRTAGKANAGDVVTVTANPSKYFECKGITVTYTELPSKAKKTIEATGSGNSYTFTVPEGLSKETVKDATISVKGTFALTSTGKSEYVKAHGNGLYIDVAPSKNDTTATLIKWNDYQGRDQGTTDNYIFYVPKNVDLTNAVIYNTTGSDITLGDKTISNNDKAEGVNLTVGDNTITGGSVNNVKVMQGSTDAMFLYTTNADGTDFDLPTARRWTSDYGITDEMASAYKDTIKSSGGNCVTMNNDSEVTEANRFSSAMGLDTVKGRGNSSWKASATMFGKYAFNMKLKSKTNLLGMDSAESSGAKSWCLLANNADQSMLRNAMTYQLAAQIGLLYSPEFRFVDIYDNSEYMGSYLVTEKVDVGNSKLVKGKSFEDLIEDVVGTVNEDYVTEYDTDGTTPILRYAKVTADGSTNPSIPVKTDGKYLLEFEISERVTAEASFFRSNKGQYVVVKSPEFATKEQVEYVREKFNAMEAIVYNDSSTRDQLDTVIDVESFAKMYLIQEFSSNLDSASTSYYVTLDCSKNNAEGNGAVFVANPVWDYDWAYGQYNNKNLQFENSKKDISNNVLDTANPEAWVAKNKAMDDSKYSSKGRSIQSQLAGTNEAFKTEVRKQWESNSSTGFLKNIKTYYEGENNQLDTWYNAIKASVDMNETRWGFIKDNPLSGWGSNNATTDSRDFTGAVKYLKTTWTEARATWLNSQFQTEEYAAFTPVAPTAAAYTADGSLTLTTVPQGTPFIIKATSTDSDVVFRLYDSKGTQVGTDSADGEFIIQTKDITPDTTLTYTVKAVYKTVNNTEGTESVASDPAINVKVTANSDTKTVTIYFKSASASVYVPSLSIDGGNASVMSRNKIGAENSTYFGSNYSGSLKFYWFYTTVTLDTTKTHTLRFTTKENLVDASMTLMLNTQADNKYYFAVDNLMGGDTTLVNLTGKPEYIRNWHISATHMVHSDKVVSDPGYNDNSIGFTWVPGEDGKYREYAMGSIVKKNENSTQNVNLTNLSSLEALSTVNPKSALTALSAGPYFTIKSATLAQQITAGIANVSELQYQLLDVNLDGVVNVKDATMMQKALAKF